MTRSTQQRRVAADFIVDSTGRPRSSSWRTIASSDPGTVQTVRSMYLRQRYEPARLGQQPVCELLLAEVRFFRTEKELGR
jgi:hypothetical protein